MKFAFTKLMLGAAVMLVATCSYAQEQFQFASHTMFAQLEQEVQHTNGELSEIKARLASLESGDMAMMQKPAYGGDCCCDCWCNPCCGWTGSAEVVWLRAHDSEPDSPSGTRLEHGSRFTLAHMDDCGRSWRVRYFEYNDPSWDIPGSLNLEMWDFEYAARFQLGCNWRGEIAAGLRYADARDDVNNDYEDTIGPVVSVEVRNELWCDVDIFALYRRSQQFGDEVTNDTHGTFGITEIQVGAEVTRCVAGQDLFVRTFIEAQEWAGIEDGDSEDLGLIGFGFAIGLAR